MGKTKKPCPCDPPAIAPKKKKRQYKKKKKVPAEVIDFPKKKKKCSRKKKSTLTKKKALKFYTLLKVLHKLNGADFNTISQYLDEEAYSILSECIHNSICSQSVDAKTREKLKNILWSKKDKVRYLADKNKSFKKKKKIIPQIGGNIGLIIASVLPMIYNFLKDKKII